MPLSARWHEAGDAHERAAAAKNKHRAHSSADVNGRRMSRRGLSTYAGGDNMNDSLLYSRAALWRRFLYTPTTNNPHGGSKHRAISRISIVPTFSIPLITRWQRTNSRQIDERVAGGEETATRRCAHLRAPFALPACPLTTTSKQQRREGRASRQRTGVPALPRAASSSRLYPPTRCALRRSGHRAAAAGLSQSRCLLSADNKLRTTM